MTAFKVFDIFKNSKKDKYSALRVGLLCAAIMLIVMLPSMVRNHGIYVIRGDYVDQYVARLLNARTILTDDGGATWNWNSFLGLPYSALQVLFSLNSVCLLFPQSLIPYAVTYMHLVRVALIGACSFAYLRYMVSDKRLAFLGALLYTFSSYTFISLEFMQFLESLWTFPLLLLAVERMFRSENYRHQLILGVFLCCTTSFYFFVFSTVSFSLYFVCRFFLCDEWKEKRDLRHFFLAVTEYIIGFLCAGFLVVPYLYKLFSSAGSAEKIGTAGSNAWFELKGIFSRLFSLFTPAASNRINTFGTTRWLTRAAYVPIFGISFAVGSCFNKKIKNRKWIAALSVISVVCILWSGVSLVYNMLSSTYTRYAYAMLLFFVLATVIFIESYDGRVAKRAAYATAACFGVLTGVYYFCLRYLAPKYESVADIVCSDTPYEVDYESVFRTFALISAAVMLALLIAFVNSAWVRRRIIPCAAAVLVIYGSCYTVMNLRNDCLLDYYPQSSITLDRQVELYYLDHPTFDSADDHRIDHSKQLRNYAYAAQKPSISVFESVQNQYSVEMASYFGMHNGVVTILPNNQDNAYRTLLGVKYYYDLYPQDNLPIPDGFSYLRTENGIDVYKNDSFTGMGFTYDSYMTRSEFDSVQTSETAASIMLNTLVVEDSDEQFVSGILKHYGEQTEEAERISFSEFHTDSDGFSAEISTEGKQVVFVSVPYEDEGWEIKVNGEPVEFIRANVGCMAFTVESGTSTVKATYSSPANTAGYAVSFAGILISALYLFLCRRKRDK